ncbi:hypothetical protein MY9_3438 [Bacillus sp. JS]|nr:hypothetical protein MY9_3438 [Bacillus sp. JS]
MKTGFQKTLCERETTAFLAALPALSPKAAALAFRRTALCRKKTAICPSGVIA